MRSDTVFETALKTLKEGSTNQDKVKFLQEAAIMAQFKHPNVVSLYGVVSDKEPVSMNYCTIFNEVIVMMSLVDACCGDDARRRFKRFSILNKT